MSLSVLFYATLVGIIPSIVWLLFWLHEDIDHPEPKRLIFIAFLGGCIAVIFALFPERYLSTIIHHSGWCYVGWALVEEIMKFLVFLVLILHSRHYDEPIDAMIYMITISLGFAALENILFIIDPFAVGNFTKGIITENMRFIGANLVHVVCSAIIGFSLGYSFYFKKIYKVICATIGIILAIALHSLFNLSIINGGAMGIINTFVWIWVAVIILLLLFEEIKAVKAKTIIIKNHVQ